MKFVTVRDFRSRSAQIWQQLKEEDEMVITSNGKPVALLTPLTDDTLESTLTTLRKAKAMAAVKAMQMQSVEHGYEKMTLNDINAEINAARKGRQR